eukprot:3811707-Pyramimonas_sp.AAC.1
MGLLRLRYEEYDCYSQCQGTGAATSYYYSPTAYYSGDISASTGVSVLLQYLSKNTTTVRQQHYQYSVRTYDYKSSVAT